ncbi:MAG: uracil-DNA glycosylase [Pseudomonadota bacterium]
MSRETIFLEEMGIALWTPRAAIAAAPDAIAAPRAVHEAAPPGAVSGRAPLPQQPTMAPVVQSVSEEPDVAAMDWPALRAAIASCTRCGQCQKPVMGSGSHTARWMVVAGATTAADEQAGTPLAGEAGKLLTNMLFAAGLARDDDAYVTNLVKCRPVTASGGDRAPTSDEAAACRPFVERELVLTGAQTVLTLGQVAANTLLGRGLVEPLAGARGTVHQLAGVPLVATLHPGELLRRGADKALAWSDLCLARAPDVVDH